MDGHPDWMPRDEKPRNWPKIRQGFWMYVGFMLMAGFLVWGFLETFDLMPGSGLR